MAVTGDDVISEALILLGVKYAGQTISPEAKATSLLGLNLLIGEWNATGQAVYSVARASYALVAGTSDYTIGSGATFNTARPEKIEAWTARTSTISDGGAPVDATAFANQREDLDTQAWEAGIAAAAALEALRVKLLDFSAAIPVQAWELALPAGTPLSRTRVKLLNYDAAYPIGTIHLYPPPVAGMTLDLSVWVQLAEVTDTTLALAFPPGYLKAIVYNLAVDLAPKFGRPLDQAIKMVADQCKAALGATNAAEHSQPTQAA